jgi:hypothetical protein
MIRVLEVGSLGDDEMPILKLASVLMIAALATGCGDEPNPVGPNSPAAPTVASLVISGPDYVLTGSTTAYTATATLSDGSTRTVTPTWTSSAVNVGIIDNAGRLDGRAHGATMLTVAHDGGSASKTVQVVNNYGGSWSGRYIIRACNDSGIFTDGIGTDVPWCQGRTGIGKQTLLTPFTVVQTGTNYSEIRATFDQACDAFFGSGTISGGVTADGRLHLEGTLKLLDWYCDPDMDLQISGWDTNLEGAGSMTGRWTQDLTIIGREGSAHEEVELVTMSRTATASTSR